MLLILATNDIADPKNVPHLEDACQLAREETTKAVIEASQVPLSIMVVGIGDGPWEIFDAFNNHIHWREFDNFSFAAWDDVAEEKFPAYEIGKRCLSQVPNQLKQLRKLGMID